MSALRKLCAVAAAGVAAAYAVPPQVNDEPVIGILTVPLDAEEACLTLALRDGLHGGAGARGALSCATAFYPKWIEAAGARAVWIPYNANASVLDALFASVNGVLFTGGGADLRFNTTYLQAAAYLYDKVVAANDAGDFIPLHGSCMGFQAISIIVARNESVLRTNAFDAENISLPLAFTPDAVNTRLFGGAPDAVFATFAHENSTINLHHDGVPPSAYAENPRLAAALVMAATNVDRAGSPFVSAWEGRAYPVTATQFHPERPIFEWKRGIGLNHAPDVVRANRYIADFFVDDARRNAHRFDDALAAAYSVYATAHTVASEGRVMDGYQAYILEY